MSLSKYLLNAQTYTVKIDAPPINLESQCNSDKKSIQNFTWFVKITSKIDLEELKPKNNHDKAKNEEQRSGTFSMRYQEAIVSVEHVVLPPNKYISRLDE